MKFTLLALQLVLAMAFKYDFQAHDHSEALDELAVAHGLSFHSKALSGVRGSGVVVYRRANIDVVIRPLGGRTGAVL